MPRVSHAVSMVEVRAGYAEFGAICWCVLALGCSAKGTAIEGSGGGPGGSEGTGGLAVTGGASSMAGAASTSGGSGTGGNVNGSEYTVIGYNNASWAGSGTSDVISVNESGYLPLTASDCPKDPDMQIVEPYQDKIFNGCLDECAGDPNMWGHDQATVFDWTLTQGGWVVAQLSSNLHWTGIWPPADGPHPTTLVFWIKGGVGGEQDKFTVSVHAHGTNDNSTALQVPIEVTTSWQRVVIPWASFNVLASGYPDALTFSATAAGDVTFFIDQAYVSKTVAPP